MSILSKVFAVLLVVMSIGLTSMTVSFVSQTTNWRDTAEKYQEHARIADTNLRHEIAASAGLLATARDEVKEQMKRSSDLQAGVAAARAEAAQLRTDLAKAQAERATLTAMNSALVSQFNVADSARQLYMKQRDDLERTNIDVGQRNVGLNDRVYELTAQLDVRIEQQRHAEQQINSLTNDVERLSRLTGAAGAQPFENSRSARDAVALSPVPARQIRARVADVSGDLITINVGSADGVKRNMEFVVHRNDNFVGDLRITTVEPNRSAGRMTVTSSPVRKGDDVTDARTLTAGK